ncbi:uncharacterized protein LOC109825859 isoform X1 [Asparagus officinalis]|uniref:uncharacterized protein LOC109825859 isoform X1 n=1 Tax=Asparagus officinalis TaxID=4686 RepID=UPI00098E7389|nr:uncharacterized protein LOC109825859 isoform X1 [Asparagus officinalis]
MVPNSAASKAIAKVFLSAVINNCPPILLADAERVVECLLDGVAVAGTSLSENSVSSSPWDSKGKGKDESGEVMDDGSSEAVRDNGSGTPRRSVLDQVLTPTLSSQSYAGRFEEESVEELERMEIVFWLVVDVLDRGGKSLVLRNLEEVQLTATAQIKSLSAFLKLVLLLSQIKINSMAIVRMKSDGYEEFEKTREFSNVNDVSTSSVEQIEGMCEFRSYQNFSFGFFKVSWSP